MTGPTMMMKTKKGDWSSSRSLSFDHSANQVKNAMVRNIMMRLWMLRSMVAGGEVVAVVLVYARLLKRWCP